MSHLFGMVGMEGSTSFGYIKMWSFIRRELYQKVIFIITSKKKKKNSNAHNEFVMFRWIHECPAQGKCCPTCKTKAKQSDIRIVYAKRVVVADKIEEERLNKIVA